MEISLLPDDVIKYIMEFWSPRHERMLRRMEMFIDFSTGFTSFKDPNTYLVKLMTLPRPSGRFHDYYFTKSCFIVDTHGSGSNKRIHLKKNLHKYHAYLQQEIIPMYKYMLRIVMEKIFKCDYCKLQYKIAKKW